MTFRIAGLLIETSDQTMAEAIDYMSEFQIFEDRQRQNESSIMTLSYVGNQQNIFCLTNSKLIYNITADDTEIFFYKDNYGGYILKTEFKGGIMIMQCHPENPTVLFTGTLSRRQLKYALWMTYAIHALKHGRVAVHSSAVEYYGNAYLFLGESGTGKSTHTRLWTENILGATLLNDDSPILSCDTDGIRIYGSPWSGKTPCHRTDNFPLAAMTRIIQAKTNEIRRLNILQAFGAIHPSMPPAFGYDEYLSNLLAKIESRIIEKIPVCDMNCLPNAEAALTSHKFLLHINPNRR